MAEYEKAWRQFKRNRGALAGLLGIGLAAVIALFAYVLAPDNSPKANRQLSDFTFLAPGSTAEVWAIPLSGAAAPPGFLGRIFQGEPARFRYVPAKRFELFGDSLVSGPTSGAQERISAAGTALQRLHFPLGTDKYGRCVWSRVLLGFRISLLVGLLAVLVSVTIGIIVGALGGYFGGKIDDFAMFIINTAWSIPTLLLVFSIVLALGRGISVIFVAVGLTLWVDMARLVRGQTMAFKNLPFVEAAKSMGYSDFRILFRHILPNLLGPVAVIAAGNFATAILIESGLSYLGFGVQPPTPSWGDMLHENYGYAFSGKPWLALAPASAIVLTVLAFNLIGNGIRDALDVR